MNYNDQLYLEHHGIKGMHWGVRRYQNADGTLTSAGKKKYGNNIQDRKVKQVKKQILAGLKSNKLDYSQIDKKGETKLAKTEEYKAYKNMYDFLSSAQKATNGKQLVVGRDDAKAINEVSSKMQSKVKEIINSYNDEYASKTLKDLGYEDTKIGRQWLIDNNLVGVKD